MDYDLKCTASEFARPFESVEPRDVLKIYC